MKLIRVFKLNGFLKQSRVFRVFCLIIACYGLYIILNFIFYKEIFFKGSHLKCNSTGSQNVINEKLSTPKDDVNQNLTHGVGDDNLNLNYSKNCGLPFECTYDEFPIHLYTGRANSEKPRICINHLYSALPYFKNLGRGFNVAVVDPKAVKVVRFGNFDTFATESKKLEEFLELLEAGFLAVFVVYDDGSTRLSASVRDVITSLGSSLIMNLAFRDVWVFVGRKNLSGFSPIEHIEYSIYGWPRPISLRTCVKRNFVGVEVRADVTARVNEGRRKFCVESQFDNSFCSAENIDEPLSTLPLFDPALENSSLFSAPVVIVPGPDINVFRMQVEALLFNPGILKENIHVFLPENEELFIKLSVLLDLKIHLLVNSFFEVDDYADIFLGSFKHSWENFNAQYIVFLEQHVIPSNNFLSFMAQCMDVLQNDSSLMAASAWNPLGLSLTASNENRAIRSGVFPGVGFIMSRHVYDTHLKPRWSEFNHISALDGWSIPGLTVDTIIPEVSRVFILPNFHPGMASLFTKIVVSIDEKLETKIDDPNVLKKGNYSTYLENLISKSAIIPEKDVELFCRERMLCSDDDHKHCKSIDSLFASNIGPSYVVRSAERTDQSSPSALRNLLTCLVGVDFHQNFERTINAIQYQHIVKLSLVGRDIIIITDKYTPGKS
ncbi:hypothetical protein HELRODRAFT_192532 [Helobdella robusta]|uniref:Alpha-1,3-mannosyl-glycoprotein 2-beta-N-acetylglucosaminyltransferase n=1 Tax=Helobdella robusta TaxID=6412 RepID=T1FU21_HELRO|nr:hypothetical protein HELRODRAFT_192532 [Helobdella robusta]ESO00577.1 hypothetical protein HELRODRAFT_192532 [Helobdella robusta]